MGHKGKYENGCMIDYYVSDEELDREFDDYIHDRYKRDMKKWSKTPNLYEYLKYNPLVDIKKQKKELEKVRQPKPEVYATEDELEALAMSKMW